MWRVTILALPVSLLVSATSVAETFSDYSIGIESAARFTGAEKLTNAAVRFGAEIEHQNDRWTFKFNGYGRYDSVYDLHDGYSRHAEDEYQQKLWIDDAYISWTGESLRAIFGYQKVVWGQADDLQITDTVNPLDFRDFVLFDIDEYRISTPMVRLQIPASNWEYEFLWVLDSEPNRYPMPGSEFDVGYPASLDKVESDGTEVGASATGFVGGADVGFYTFYGHNDDPILDPGDSHEGFVYDRELMVGASLAKPISSWVARGEIAYTPDRKHDTAMLSHDQSDVVDMLLGLDYLYGDWFVTLQLSDSWVTDWENSFVSPEHDALYTLSADTNWLAGKLSTRFAASYSVEGGGGSLYQTKINYQPDRHWKLQFNVDVMSGDRSNIFGQFKRKDRVWCAINYMF